MGKDVKLNSDPYESRVLRATRTYSTRVLTVRHGHDETSAALDAIGSCSRAHFVVDRRVYAIRPDVVSLISKMTAAMKDPGLLLVGGTERIKSLTDTQHMLRWFDVRGVSRRSEPVVAVGGGALLDAVAFATSVYRRGVPCVKVPTTLTGMVDAAFGAKTAINFSGRKNLVGSYNPPAAVLVNYRFLTTLPLRHISGGLAEVLKVALAGDEVLLNLLDDDVEGMRKRRFQSGVDVNVLGRAANGLVESIWCDLWESVLERDMDFGHSISKTIEEYVRPRPTHGEAVAMDMALMLAVSRHRGLLDQADFTRAVGLIGRAGLPIGSEQLSADILELAVADTRTHRDGGERFPLVGPLGVTTFSRVAARELIAAQELLKS